jgi:hypothetical protein
MTTEKSRNGPRSARAAQKYTFYCSGHPNIRAKHESTIEFTREAELTQRGTCIIGVRAGYDLSKVKRLSGKIKITVQVGEIEDKFYAVINPDFGDEHEIVFRKSRFNSPRTLGFRLNKGAKALRRDIVMLMKDPQTVMKVTFEELRKKARMVYHSV